VRDGWEYVAATYSLIVVVLGLWFSMIGAKLRRQRRERDQVDG